MCMCMCVSGAYDVSAGAFRSEGIGSIGSSSEEERVSERAGCVCGRPRRSQLDGAGS